MLLAALFATHCLFSPPENWVIADPKMPSKRCLASFLEKKKTGFCPSINLTHEKISVSKQEYLSIVERNCKAKRQNWRHLGQIETQDGKAELTQIETKTKLGEIRLFQALVFDQDDVFILTLSSLKKEFGKHAALMEKVIRSMRTTPDLFALVTDESSQKALRAAWQKRAHDIESKTFEEMVLELGAEIGSVWQIQMMRQ